MSAEDAVANIMDFFKHLLQDATEFRCAHRSSPPENGPEPDLRRPAFARVKTPESEGDSHNRTGQMDTGFGSFGHRNLVHELQPILTAEQHGVPDGMQSTRALPPGC